MECLPNLLERCNQNQYGYPNEMLDHWLAAFVTEVCQSNGKQYTATSFNCILAGIYRHLKSKLNDRAPKFLEKKAVNFLMFKNALDRQLKLLRNTGIGIERNRANGRPTLVMWCPWNEFSCCSTKCSLSYAYVGFKSSTTCVSPKLFVSTIQTDILTSMDQRTAMEESMTTNLTTNV